MVYPTAPKPFRHDGRCNCLRCMSALHSDGFPNPYAPRPPYQRVPRNRAALRQAEGEGR